MSPVYESLCRSLAVDLDHEQEMEETTHHVVNDDCGHWTVRRILALGDHAGSDISVAYAAVPLKVVGTRSI